MILVGPFQIQLILWFYSSVIFKKRQSRNLQGLRSEFYLWVLERVFSIWKSKLSCSSVICRFWKRISGWVSCTILFHGFKQLRKETKSYLVFRETLLKNDQCVLSVNWWLQRRAVSAEPADKQTCKHDLRPQGWGCKQDGNVESPGNENWGWQPISILWGYVHGDNFLQPLCKATFLFLKSIFSVSFCPRRLDANHINYVPPNCFNGLVSLRHLWLDDNSLTEIPVQAFRSLPALQAMTLALNKIHYIPDYAFGNLSSLVVL